MQIGDRAQELAEACGGRPLAAHMVGTALLSGTAQLEEVLQAVASPGVAHLQPLDRFSTCFSDACHTIVHTSRLTFHLGSLGPGHISAITGACCALPQALHMACLLWDGLPEVLMASSLALYMVVL